MKAKEFSGVRYNITPMRPCVSGMKTTADMKMLQVYIPRTIGSMLEARKKYVYLVHIYNISQPNIHDRKGSMEHH